MIAPPQPGLLPDGLLARVSERRVHLVAGPSGSLQSHSRRSPSQPSVPHSQLLDFSLLPDSLSSCPDPNMDSRSQLCVLLSLRFPARCMALKSGETFMKCPLNTENCTRLYVSLAMVCILIRTTWETSHYCSRARWQKSCNSCAVYL